MASNSTQNFNQPVVKDNGRAHYGNIYGNVHNTDINIGGNFDYKERILRSLRFDGMDRHHSRRLDSYDGTYESIFVEDGRARKCTYCSGLKPDGQCRGPHESLKAREQAAKDFQLWLETSRSTFWIAGKPGSGKSTLMKFLVEHPETAAALRRWGGRDVEICSFFFWMAGSQLERSQEGLLRSLLHQLLQRHPDLIDRHLGSQSQECLITPDYHPVWALKVLRKTLRSVLQDQTIALRCCVFVDGLDEFDGDHNDLLELLHSLEESHFVKMCVSSRAWNVFEEYCATRPAGLQLRLQDINSADIHEYISGRFESHPRYNHRLYLDLLNKIFARAQGVFLWVFLVTSELRRGMDKNDTIQMLDDRLRALPTDMDQYLQKIFDDVDPVHQQIGARTLLVMHLHDDNIPLPFVSYLEENLKDPKFATRAPMQRASPTQMCKLLSESAVSVKRWGQDLLDIEVHPYDEANVFARLKNSMTGTFGCHIRYGHRTIKDFMSDKYRDGTLHRLAGPPFDPAIASARATVRSAKMLQLSAKGTRQIASMIPYLAHQAALLQHLSQPAEWVELFYEFERILEQRMAERQEKRHWIMEGNPSLGSWPILSYADCKAIAMQALAVCTNTTTMYNMILSFPRQGKRDADASIAHNAARHCALLEITLYKRLDLMESRDALVSWSGTSTLELLSLIPDLNEPVPRVGGGNQSVWQLYISTLNREMHAHLFERYGELPEMEISAISRTVHGMLARGADPQATVNVCDPTDTRRLRDQPARLAFEVDIKQMVDESLSLYRAEKERFELISCIEEIRAMLHDASEAKHRGVHPGFWGDMWKYTYDGHITMDPIL